VRHRLPPQPRSNPSFRPEHLHVNLMRLPAVLDLLPHPIIPKIHKTHPPHRPYKQHLIPLIRPILPLQFLRFKLVILRLNKTTANLSTERTSKGNSYFGWASGWLALFYGRSRGVWAGLGFEDGEGRFLG
jgi:hypothetical protein